MREIVLDTETTGLDPLQGHRLVEIGCIELVNRIPSGQTFHRYLNPERDDAGGSLRGPRPVGRLPQGQAAVRRRRRRPARVPRRRAAGGAQRAVRSRLPQRRARTRGQARRSRASGWSTRCCWRAAGIRAAPTGSTICARATASTIRDRTKHGALLDAELLAEVYVELIGGRQASLVLVESGRAAAARAVQRGRAAAARPAHAAPVGAERAAHAAFIATLGDKAIWLDYPQQPSSIE